MKKQSILKTSVFLVTLAALLGCWCFLYWCPCLWDADLSIREVYSVIVYELFHVERFAKFGEGAVHDVVWLIRLPRILLALAVGMGLSVCGVVMQAVVKNPLADPYVLGISSGASLGATVAILLGIGAFFGGNFVGIMAFLGALAASLAVVFLANLGGRANAGKLVLTGMAVSSVCSAFSSFAIYLANKSDATAQVTYWTMGSLANTKWGEIQVILPVMAVGTLVFWSQFRNLNMMLLETRHPSRWGRICIKPGCFTWQSPPSWWDLPCTLPV